MILDANILKDFKMGRLEPLYRTAYAALFSFASGILGEECAFLAEDCVQDAILRSYEMKHKFKSASSWQSFLFVTTHNNCVSILRKNGSYQRYLDALVEDTFEKDSLYKMIESETREILSVTLSSLPEKMKALYEMCYVEGLNNQEVADKVGLSLSGLKKQKRQLLETIENALVK